MYPEGCDIEVREWTPKGQEIVKADLLGKLTTDSPALREWKRAALERIYDDVRYSHNPEAFNGISANDIESIRDQFMSISIPEDVAQKIVNVSMDKKQLEMEQKQKQVEKEMMYWDDDESWQIDRAVRHGLMPLILEMAKPVVEDKPNEIQITVAVPNNEIVTDETVAVEGEPIPEIVKEPTEAPNEIPMVEQPTTKFYPVHKMAPYTKKACGPKYPIQKMVEYKK